MKTSTLMTMVMLSASCFAAPMHTANEATAAPPGAVHPEDVNAAPVAPAAPGVTATDPSQQRWVHITLPKSHRLDQRFMVQDEHQQT
ncbi:hypothetical protein [Paraburkholderia phosphatilytica]|uniref:hypothetical protein n=1 Tax=Paraburkholderia phosphatilytica TaxID=2282883 RepID=UPI000E50D43D|nr:hypothetical protein [Paraburkholderia phosphatilytica]